MSQPGLADACLPAEDGEGCRAAALPALVAQLQPQIDAPKQHHPARTHDGLPYQGAAAAAGHTSVLSSEMQSVLSSEMHLPDVP